MRVGMRLLYLLRFVLFAGMMFLIPVIAHPQAQDKKKEKKPREKDLVSLEFNLNYSVVLGNYGKTDRENKNSGYAKNGWVSQLGLNWCGPRGWGLGFQWALQRNGYQDIAATTNPYGTKYVLGSSGWTNNYLMAGPVFIKDFGKIELNTKALFGLIVSNSTNFNVQNPYDSTNVSVTATGFGYAVNVGVGYRINKHWGVQVNLGYLGGTPKATKTYGQELVYIERKDSATGVIYYVPVYSQGAKYEIKKIVSTFNGGIGVIYHF